MKTMNRNNSIADELKKAGGYAETAGANQSVKKNFAERLSRLLATRIANGLRPTFRGILPHKDGSGQESRARTAKGHKKLDVNYSMPDLGLALGVSVKTLNFRDAGTDRYTKNFTRIDNELRAEAADYHERQPHAVMVAILFLPLDSCSDGSENGDALSSFAQAIKIFRPRCGRRSPADHPALFERFFIALYDTDPEQFGNLSCFDITGKPRKRGFPRNTIPFGVMLEKIVAAYDERNNPRIEWDEDPG